MYRGICSIIFEEVLKPYTPCYCEIKGLYTFDYRIFIFLT